MLEEIKNLPKKVVDNLDAEIKNLKVYLVQDFNLITLRRMVNFSSNVFGESGMDEWALVPQIRHGNVFVLKAEEQKKIMGIAILMRDWEDVEKAYLFDYAIADEVQGQGLGYHFLLTICDNLKEQGFKRMSLTVDIANAPALKLYKDKLGFKTAKLSKDEYGEGHDRYIMELDLAAVPAKIG